MLNKRNILILIVLVFGLLVACSGCSSCSGPKPEPTPTLAPTVPPEMDDSWSRIQAAGKIVVGTSADYPPFAYYPPFTYATTGELHIDGLDIALMNEIGRHLGVQVEFHDLAFDGLLGALQVEQIDVAIGAISATPERQAVVDFSEVYYVGQDAILAGADATISVGSVADLVGHKIGVQSGSVYETWLQDNLVDTGQMPSSNLLAYARSDDAITDLAGRRVDLVVLDYLPAQRFANRGNVKIVGYSLNQQVYAIATRKGATTLLAEINQALAQLQDEGKICQLAQEYVGLAPAEIVPTPTPGSGPTATPPLPPSHPCIDSMALVQELTDDNQDTTSPPQMNPGQAFTKGWRVRNTGTCEWDDTYRFVFGQGNVPGARMGGEPVAIEREVSSGDTYDVQINLVAPSEPGNYQAFWQMVDGRGISFGERIYVGIEVPR